MCWNKRFNFNYKCVKVSVAGFLGYDVLVIGNIEWDEICDVSVAGFLGYDVLEVFLTRLCGIQLFQLLAF